MRKLAFILTVLLVSAAPALTQTPSGAWADKLFMNKTVHDFGNVARGLQLKYSFPIRNIYAVPLEITNVRVSCGCVTAIPSKKVLQPQEEGTLDCNMDGTRFSGFKTITVHVTVGPDYVSTATLTIKANARTDVVFNPGEFNFGMVPQGQQPVKTVDVEYAGSLNWQIKEVVKPPEAPIAVKVQELYRNPGRVGYRMTVSLNADAPAGQFKHELILKTNDPSSEVMTVAVDGNVQATLRAAPSLVSLGSMKVNEARTFKVQVLANRPFRIMDVKSTGNDITTELPQQALTVHTLTLRCTPTAMGEVRRQLTVFTDLDKGASVTVTVQGTAN